MCSSNTSIEQQEKKAIVLDNNNVTTTSSFVTKRTRREKRDKVGTYVIIVPPTTMTKKKKKKRKSSRALQRHGEDGKSGGMSAFLPSFIGLVILVCGVMAKMGFRGRANIAGIDLGTTNSVICVQAPSKGVGTIDCIRDPSTNSSIIPSVVSFLEPEELKSMTTISKKHREHPSPLVPHPSKVLVGSLAKKRIETHPHHTLYHAKRALGRSYKDVSNTLQKEVEFRIKSKYEEYDDMNDEVDVEPVMYDIVRYHHHHNDNNIHKDEVVFEVPMMDDHDNDDDPSILSISPKQVGSYVVHYLIQITSTFLGHDNVQSAVICVPAKFDAHQRQLTVDAFKDAGVTVTRILEEPTAAALAYGLHKKENVEYILVYDFGGGTLDISLLHVSDGYVEVMGSDGDDRLGGSDFDAVIAQDLLERYGTVAVDPTKHALDKLGIQEDGLECTIDDDDDDIPLCTHASFHTIAERLKIELSSFSDEDAVATATCLMIPESSVSTISSIDDFCHALIPISPKLQLSLKHMNTIVSSLFERSVIPIQPLLQDLNVDHDEIDEVVMVGGTTRMPQIRTLVQNEMKVKSLNTHIDPDITVAYGAASVID